MPEDQEEQGILYRNVSGIINQFDNFDTKIVLIYWNLDGFMTCSITTMLGTLLMIDT